MDTKPTEKISIGGLRFSSEQTQLDLAGFLTGISDFVTFLDETAENKINLPFLCLDTICGTRASVCLAVEDSERQREVLSGFLRRGPVIPEWIPSTGSLTLFPHQSRLKTLGALLEIFGKNRIPLYSLCSSISALVVNTDYHQLNQAARALQTVFHLPENHSPFRQQATGANTGHEGPACDHCAVVETAAAYWEPVIKIYGSSVRTDLLMTTALVAESQLACAGIELQAVGSGEAVFEMALIQRVDDKTYKLVLLYESSLVESYRTLFMSCDAPFSGTDHRPAELLYLHGPHFHDRYGVASAALRTLQMKNELFGVGCAGTSIYLITPSKTAEMGADALKKIFIVPRFS